MSGFIGEKDPAELRARTVWVTGLVIAAFIIIAGRLWHLQLMNSDYFGDLSMNNRIRLIKNYAARGMVYDANGTLLAENKPSFTLYVVPEDVNDMDFTRTFLSTRAGIDPKYLDDKIAKEKKKRAPYNPIKIKSDIGWDEMAAITMHEYELHGVYVEAEPRRTYIEGAEAMAHVLGYVSEINSTELVSMNADAGGVYAPGDFIGKFGMESSFEATLKGVHGGRQVEVDAHGRPIRTIKKIAPSPGHTVRLTIDYPTQRAAWEGLGKERGAVVAIDPKSGRILALVSTPSFPPDLMSYGISEEDWKTLTEDEADPLTNRAVQGSYPPASTFKPVTALAALETGTIKPDTKIYSGGSFRFGNRDFRDWKPSGHGSINVHRAIVESSDTFFYQAGLKTGVDNIAKYAKDFGLGEKTGIKLRGEQVGLIPTKDWKMKTYGKQWIEGETIPITVGQGYVLATPLQLAILYAAIANGGDVYAPGFIESIESVNGEVIEQFMPKIRRTLDASPENIEVVRNALRGVVIEEGGTAGSINDPSLKIAGKTGTAQVRRMTERIRDISKIAYKNRDHALFVGFAPFDDPKIAVAVIVEHGGFGARAAAPVALKVIRAYLKKDAITEQAKPVIQKTEKTAPSKATAPAQAENTAPADKKPAEGTAAPEAAVLPEKKKTEEAHD
ncbi:MAG: penicillin-binding protein 2 [Deltaproteobacteria bacterium]|nr:penicillin-binding protein 2 [Deltaproteobacteria bacterium]